ncbi:esterase B1 [Drosophila pseudoobscura]|uniref:carboxylesterase n=1 Tax=Drosophila pseudoobscura pseudoobscura TaxID=46245 RepID=A0A6I8URJ7_DROPS|nr:esterase B1 [Drosophila pseudoobscura]
MRFQSHLASQPYWIQRSAPLPHRIGKSNTVFWRTSFRTQQNSQQHEKMEVQVGWQKLLKMGAKLVGHKYQQYRLATNNTVVLDTENGQVMGLQRKTLYDEELYYAFEGIPYAKAPIGELRFRAPEPAEPWKGVLNCTTYRSKPMQRNMVMGIIEGSEDCLHLNVYAKTLQSEQPLPVIVWIYGGGFQKGEASRDIYSPDYFMKQPVVFVCINYRLGALGFLSLKDPKLNVPGNAGLKDQVMALRWISDNIAHFNGDPDNITLMGESAGAASTHIMMTTEQTRGLFHKAILQSGCALSEWVESPDHQWAYRLAQQMGYKGGEKDADVLKYLTKISARQIANTDQDIITREEIRSFLLFAFGPVVEPYETSHCVVPVRHKDMLPHAWSNDIPVIVGGNSFEGLFSYQLLRGDPWAQSHFHNIIPREVSEAATEEQRDELVRRLKKVYFDDEKRDKMGFFEALNIFSHRQIWHDLHRVVMSRLAYAPTQPTYLYRFDFDSPHFNQFRRLVCGDRIRGVSHADELSYMFYNIISPKISKSSQEYHTIERMVGMWTAFAATGDPNCPAIAPAEWLPVERTENGVEHCLNISQKLEMIELPEAEALAVWDSFYPKEALY